MLAQLTDKSNAGPDPLVNLKHIIPRPKIYQTYADPGPVHPRPNYIAMTQNNSVTQEVLNSLGGIQDTVSPMKESLLKNELRPYDYVRAPPLNERQTNSFALLRNFSTPVANEGSLKVRSVSPYRATIQIDASTVQLDPPRQNNTTQSDDASNEDEDFERDGTLTQQPEVTVSPMATYKQTRKSPIKSDS